MFKYNPNTNYMFYAEDFETDMVMAYDFDAYETAESYGEEYCKAVLSELRLDVPHEGACEALAEHYNREDIRTSVRETYIELHKPDFEAIMKKVKNLIWDAIEDDVEDTTTEDGDGEIYMTVDYSTIRPADMSGVIDNYRYVVRLDGLEGASEVVEAILGTPFPTYPDYIKFYVSGRKSYAYEDVSTKPETAVII